MQRDHHAAVMRLLPQLRKVINDDPDVEPIEAASALVAVALEVAELYGKQAPNVAVQGILDDMWHIYVQNN